MNWKKVCRSLDLVEDKPKVVKTGNLQLGLWRRSEKVFAFDNRCPHEGYPLVKGAIDKTCTLTCNWHNWKFRLSDGHNLLGQDQLKVFETKEEDDYIWVNVVLPKPEEVLSEQLASLQESFYRRDYGRMARILAKLSFEGLDPLEAIVHSIMVTYEHFEYGMTHAFAVTADWVHMYLKNLDDPLALSYLLEAIDHMAFDSQRFSKFPYSSLVIRWDESKFKEAIESEQEDEAISLLNGAFEQGLDLDHLERIFTEIALYHYRDFGHSLIYVTKVMDLTRQLGIEVARPLFKSLARFFIYSTKEDLIPEFKAYQGNLKLWPRHSKSSELKTPDEHWKPKSINRSMEWVIETAKTVGPEQIYSHLMSAAADQLLFYDTQFQDHIDLSVKKNAGWLTMTHSLTFGNAVRKQCEKFPTLWAAGLLQMACFLGRNEMFVDRGQPNKNTALIDESEFIKKAMARINDHGMLPPIFSAHLLKTFLAVKEEASLLPFASKVLMWQACLRFLEAPLKQKHVRRTMKQSLALVGKAYGEKLPK